MRGWWVRDFAQIEEGIKGACPLIFEMFTYMTITCITPNVIPNPPGQGERDDDVISWPIQLSGAFLLNGNAIPRIFVGYTEPIMPKNTVRLCLFWRLIAYDWLLAFLYKKEINICVNSQCSTLDISDVACL
jgi:hypothetical protein